MNDLLYWIWLSLAVTPGSKTYAKLRGSFSSPKSIYEAEPYELRRALGNNTRDLKRLSTKDLRRAEVILDFMGKRNVHALVYDDPRYPERLRRIYNPPVMLYYAGKLPNFDKRLCVSSVGSREHSVYSKNHTFEIGYDLAVAGAVVISGMAYGLDSIALAAANYAGGQTVAVLGSGIDVIYPKEHLTLARLIAKNGAVVTEYPPGTSPNGAHFPIRNRIISALGHVVTVMGGDLNSGALITASVAKQQGRPVYTIPGDLDDPYMHANAYLLRGGAKALLCADDLVLEYRDRYPDTLVLEYLLIPQTYKMDTVLRDAGVVSLKDRKRFGYGDDGPNVTVSDEFVKHMEEDRRKKREKEESERAPLPPLSDEESRIYHKIPDEGCLIDDLVDENTSASLVQSNLTLLQIKGVVELQAGNRVTRK